MGLPDVIDAVRPAVVQIGCTITRETAEEQHARLQQRPVRPPSRWLGTGFLVNDSACVVTAQHVLEAARQFVAELTYPKATMKVGLAYPPMENVHGMFDWHDAEIIEEDRPHDLALLRRIRNPFRGRFAAPEAWPEPLYGVPFLRADRPRDGDPIAVSGYPLRTLTMVTNTGVIASSWGIESKRANIPFPGFYDIYLGDVQSNPGNSGGPVYSTEDGAVLGVLVAGQLTEVVADDQPVFTEDGAPLAADAGISVIIPIKYVTEMLDRHGHAWSPAASL